MKAYFASAIGFVILYTFQIMKPSLQSRMILIVPVLLLFYITLFSFMLEYEKKGREMWRKKEKKLIESSYSKFSLAYFRRRDFTKEVRANAEEMKDNLLHHKVPVE